MSIVRTSGGAVKEVLILVVFVFSGAIKILKLHWKGEQAVLGIVKGPKTFAARQKGQSHTARVFHSYTRICDPLSTPLLDRHISQLSLAYAMTGSHDLSRLGHAYAVFFGN